MDQTKSLSWTVMKPPGPWPPPSHTLLTVEQLTAWRAPRSLVMVTTASLCVFVWHHTVRHYWQTTLIGLTLLHAMGSLRTAFLCSRVCLCAQRYIYVCVCVAVVTSLLAQFSSTGGALWLPPACYWPSVLLGHTHIYAGEHILTHTHVRAHPSRF